MDELAVYAKRAELVKDPRFEALVAAEVRKQQPYIYAWDYGAVPYAWKEAIVSAILTQLNGDLAYLTEHDVVHVLRTHIQKVRGWTEASYIELRENFLNQVEAFHWELSELTDYEDVEDVASDINIANWQMNCRMLIATHVARAFNHYSRTGYVYDAQSSQRRLLTDVDIIFDAQLSESMHDPVVHRQRFAEKITELCTYMSQETGYDMSDLAEKLHGKLHDLAEDGKKFQLEFLLRDESFEADFF